MIRAENLPPNSLGLWGDGDEIAAISDVEHLFGVQLDYSDVPNWLTAGDVFLALQRALPAEQANAAEAWSMFAEAISAETGVNPTLIKAHTRLIGTRPSGWGISLSLAALVGLVLALFC